MFRLNKTSRLFHMMLLTVPTCLSVFAVLHRSYILIAFTVVSLFVIVRIAPIFRKHKNLWMFVMVSTAAIPINLYIVKVIAESGVLFGEYKLINITYILLVYMALLSVQHIVTGVVTRVIWRKQCPINLKQNDSH